MPKALDHTTKDAIATALARRPYLAAAWVFGSVARGDAGPRSDLDVAVLLRHDGDATRDEVDDLSRLASELDRFAPGGRVDVLVLGRAGSIVHHQVIQDGVLVLDADPERRIDFVSRAISEYLDWKPTHDIWLASSLEGLAHRFERRAS